MKITKQDLLISSANSGINWWETRTATSLACSNSERRSAANQPKASSPLSGLPQPIIKIFDISYYFSTAETPRRRDYAERNNRKSLRYLCASAPLRLCG